MKATQLAGVALVVFLGWGPNSVVSAQSLERDVQIALHRLGQDIGKIDGKIGPRTRDAIDELFLENGYGEIGQASAEEILEILKEIARLRGLDLKPLAGIEIENNFPISEIPPLKPGTLWQRYWLASWVSADFNKDGLEDYLYYGTMIPENWNTSGPTTGEACGVGRECKGELFRPIMLFQTEPGFFEEVEVIVDAREVPGQSGPRQVLTADFNNDGFLDFYIADHGYGTHSGFRDSYFLSDASGKWVESSEDFIDRPDRKIFDHGATTGDIDNDGDMDIILTVLESGSSLVCLVNDGLGRLSSRNCTSSLVVAAIELGDIDGDGDLDIVAVGDDKNWGGPKLLINDGSGNFHKKIALPAGSGRYFGASEVSMWDLDNENDLDIVVSRHGDLYVGTAIQVIENQGSFKFKDQTFEIVQAPIDFQPEHEGNEWNNFVSMIRFSSVNNDDLTDIVLINNDEPSNVKVRGGVLMNRGSMQFDYFKKGEGPNTLKDIPENRFSTASFKMINEGIDKSNEESRSVETSASIAFSAAVSNLGQADDGFINSTKLQNAVLLERSGALVVGFRNFSHPSYLPNKFTVDLMIEFGSVETVLGICVEFLPEINFTSVTGSLTKTALEGLFADASIDRPDCLIGPKGLGAAPQRIRSIADDAGIEDLLWDLQYNWTRVFKSMDAIPVDEREVILSRFR